MSYKLIWAHRSVFDLALGVLQMFELVSNFETWETAPKFHIPNFS